MCSKIAHGTFQWKLVTLMRAPLICLKVPLSIIIWTFFWLSSLISCWPQVHMNGIHTQKRKRIFDRLGKIIIIKKPFKDLVQDKRWMHLMLYGWGDVILQYQLWNTRGFFFLFIINNLYIITGREKDHHTTTVALFTGCAASLLCYIFSIKEQIRFIS